MESEQLQPQLQQAQQALELALDRACGIDVRKIDTGELIIVEETLAAASKAAKEAVSVRLRLRSQRVRDRQPLGTQGQLAFGASPEITRRVFEDVRGKRWQAFAVHASSATIEHGGLPEAFRNGWLVFEAIDEVRRVAPIPEKWEELSSDELGLLCHKAPSSPRSKLL